MGDKSFEKRPPLLQSDVPNFLGEFILNGANDLEFEEVDIIFHGGEPMMLPLDRVKAACNDLIATLQGKVRFRFGIQTNGTIIDKDWVKFLKHYRFFIGISMDGDEEAHDKNRFDVKGKGSYQTIKSNLGMFREACSENNRLGVLTVLNSENNQEEICRHFSDELGFEHINLLLPDCNYEEGIPEGRSAEDYGRALIEIFDFASDKDGVYVRQIEEFLENFQIVKKNEDVKSSVFFDKNTQIIVVGSDGQLMVDDSFTPAQDVRNQVTQSYISETNMTEWLDEKAFDLIDEGYNSLAPECLKCEWKYVCGGGQLENRYSSENGFNNPSVFCNGLKLFYEHAVAELIGGGFPKEFIESRLAGNLEIDSSLAFMNNLGHNVQ